MNDASPPCLVCRMAFLSVHPETFPPAENRELTVLDFGGLHSVWPGPVASPCTPMPLPGCGTAQNPSRCHIQIRRDPRMTSRAVRIDTFGAKPDFIPGRLLQRRLGHQHGHHPPCVYFPPLPSDPGLLGDLVRGRHPYKTLTPVCPFTPFPFACHSNSHHPKPPTLVPVTSHDSPTTPRG